ncbi:Microtubule-actin cross-linking factor 1, isoforms 1/2/3/5, partial [Frankliniella fusca]
MAIRPFFGRNCVPIVVGMIAVGLVASAGIGYLIVKYYEEPVPVTATTVSPVSPEPTRMTGETGATGSTGTVTTTAATTTTTPTPTPTSTQPPGNALEHASSTRRGMDDTTIAFLNIQGVDDR